MAAGLGAGVPATRFVAQERSTELAARLRRVEPDEVAIVLAGDLFLVDAFPSALAPETRQLYELLRDSGAAVANLENGLSTVGSADLGGFRYGAALRGAPELVAELSRAGITAVSLANNHTGNFGPNALVETMRTLDRAGIGHAGAGENRAEAFAPAYFQVGSYRVALVSLYSYYYNFEANDIATDDVPGIAGSRAYDVVLSSAGGMDSEARDVEPYLLGRALGAGEPVMAPLREDVDRMTDVIEAAASDADLTLVSAHIHWGRHTRHDLPHQQRVLARRAVDAGADVFLGHGPHTLRGIEVHRGRPIFYSLGNFVLQPGQDPSGPAPDVDSRDGGRESLVARLTISGDGLRAIELVPIVIEGSGQPLVASGPIGERILAGVAGLSASLGTRVEQVEWIGNVALE